MSVHQLVMALGWTVLLWLLVVVLAVLVFYVTRDR